MMNKKKKTMSKCTRASWLGRRFFIFIYINVNMRWSHYDVKKNHDDDRHLHLCTFRAIQTSLLNYVIFKRDDISFGKQKHARTYHIRCGARYISLNCTTMTWSSPPHTHAGTRYQFEVGAAAVQKKEEFVFFFSSTLMVQNVVRVRAYMKMKKMRNEMRTEYFKKFQK